MLRSLLPPPALILLVVVVAIYHTDFPLMVEERDSSPMTAAGEASDSPGSSSQTSIALRAEPIDTDSLLVISQETLFLEERSPWYVEAAKDFPVTAPAAVQPRPRPLPIQEPPSVRLLGTVEYEGARRALVLDAASTEETWVRLGDDVQSWSVVEIRPTSMLLQLNGEEILVELGE